MAPSSSSLDNLPDFEQCPITFSITPHALNDARSFKMESSGMIRLIRPPIKDSLRVLVWDERSSSRAKEFRECRLRHLEPFRCLPKMWLNRECAPSPRPQSTTPLEPGAALPPPSMWAGFPY